MVFIWHNNEPEIHPFDISEVEHTLKIDIDPTKAGQLKYVSIDPN